MSTLIVYLTPAAATGADFPYLLSHDGQTVAAQGQAGAAMLPATPGGEVVAVVDVRALSWHALTLPRGSVSARGQATPRLRAILEGLLEERLLDETQDLHFALAPNVRPDAPVWVAVCARAWLKSALQPLEAAGRAAARIVPEFAPDSAAQPGAWHVIGAAHHALLVRPGAQGVSVLPLDAASVALAQLSGASGADAEPRVLAEPAVAGLAEAAFKRPVELQQSAQRWLQATHTAWDLAQFDLSSSSGARTFKKLSQSWQNLRHAPQWRALRWGAAGLVLAQLVGLNLWAWQEKSAQQAQRAAIAAVLTQTFPNVRVVVDAPLQMERELAALRRATGATSGGDLEALLNATSVTVPANRSATGIEFVTGELRLKGLKLTGDEAASVASRLKGQGYSGRAEADALVVQAQGQP